MKNDKRAGIHKGACPSGKGPSHDVRIENEAAASMGAAGGMPSVALMRCPDAEMEVDKNAGEVSMSPAEALRNLRQELEERRGRGERYMGLLETLFPPRMLKDREALDCAILETCMVDPGCGKEMMRCVKSFSTELDRIVYEM